MRRLIQLLCVTAAFSTVTAVRAQDEWPRIHVGAAFGRFEYAPDFRSLGAPESWPTLETSAGWKVVGGFRPARVVGVELQLVSFNEEDFEANVPGGPARANQNDLFMTADARAAVLSAVLFIPERGTRIDAYGKVGVAVLEESSRASGYDPSCGPVYCRFDVHQNDSRLYVGIGARFKITREGAIRLEYEVIDGDVNEAATMLSVGIAWER